MISMKLLARDMNFLGDYYIQHKTFLQYAVLLLLYSEYALNQRRCHLANYAHIYSIVHAPYEE